jgi:putative ABC transport system permease protein
MAVATFIALVGTSQGVERAWSQSMTGKGIHMLGFRKNAVEILSSTIDQEVVEKINQVNGVKAVAGELADLVKFETGVIGISGWPSDCFLWKTLQIQKGRLPGKNDPNGALLGQRLAHRLGLGVGDIIPLLDTKVEVIGTFRQASVLNESAMILPLSLMQQIMGKEGKVTVINLRLFHPEDIHEAAVIQARLNELYPSLSFLETKDVTEANQMINLLRKMNWSISIIAMLMGLFFILNTLLMAVNERTREIGIFIALGWRNTRIMALVLFEGMLLAIIGSATGLLIGLTGLYRLASLKYLQGFIDPSISFRFMIEVILAAIILGILGSLYPAWRTSRLWAVNALKQE